MTSRPAALESETPETDALIANIEAGKTKLSGPGLAAAISFVEPQVLENHARSLERRLSLAQTEIKGHMRVVDELKAEIAKLRGMVDECHGWLEDTRRKNAEAQSRIAELEKDAARYRWLRDNPYKKSATMLDELVPDELDAAIDAALKDRA